MQTCRQAPSVVVQKKVCTDLGEEVRRGAVEAARLLVHEEGPLLWGWGCEQTNQKWVSEFINCGAAGFDWPV